MSNRAMKIPGPDHPIEILPSTSRVVVTVGGRVIADTLEALTLSEAGYAPVQYIPRRDVDMDALTRSDHTTYCPYKGEAYYFSIPVGGSVRSMRCGPTRRRTPRWPRSRTTSPSTRTVSTRSDDGWRSQTLKAAAFGQGSGGPVKPHRIVRRRAQPVPIAPYYRAC